METRKAHGYNSTEGKVSNMLLLPLFALLRLDIDQMRFKVLSRREPYRFFAIRWTSGARNDRLAIAQTCIPICW